MKFKFKLETVLKHRSSLEQLAQRDHSLATAEVNRATNELQNLYSEVDQTRGLIQELLKLNGSNHAKIQHYESFIVNQKIKIDLKRKEIQELMIVKEQKLDDLVEAAKEKKVLEVFKEKRKKEFRLWKRKKEAKEIDEMVTNRYKRID